MSGSRLRAVLPDTACHATCIVLGEDGILIRGPSGSGKSTLALSLLSGAERECRHGRLVVDDRVRIGVRHGRLIGRAHPDLVGLIEIRGSGLHRMERCAAATVIRLVVDLVEARSRLPADSIETCEILGLTLPALSLAREQPREYLISHRLAALRQNRAGAGIVSSQTHSTLLDGIGPLGV